MSTDPGPIERARALIEEVQRYGLRSAVAVVDRYATRVEQALGTDPAGVPGDDPERLLHGLIELADTCSQLIGPAAPGAENLAFPPVAGGSASRRSVWVHNPGTESVRVTVRLTDLACAAGDTIPAPAPHTVVVAARSAAEIPLAFEVPAHATPGIYHGLALLPDAGEPLLLTLRVRGAA